MPTSKKRRKLQSFKSKPKNRFTVNKSSIILLVSFLSLYFFVTLSMVFGILNAITLSSLLLNIISLVLLFKEFIHMFRKQKV